MISNFDAASCLAWIGSWLDDDGCAVYIMSRHDMNDKRPDHTLEFLLAVDARVHHLEDGYWIKFEIRRVDATKSRPHGLSYSFTLHGPDGTRLVGFDNAHRAPAAGSRFKVRSPASDHWHRTENDRGKPYGFRDAETLLQDFFREVRRVLSECGISEAVVRVEEKGT
jgi:hypothetical protein